MRNIPVILLIVLIPFGLKAQSGSTKGSFDNLEVTINLGNEAFVPSVAYERYFPIGKSGKFFIGPGLRLFGISSNNRWRFAETNAAEDNFGDGDPNANAFIADETSIAALNLGIYLLYRISRVEIGINTDFVGFTISQSTSGSFENAADGSLTPLQNIDAQRVVLFPFDGSYNTEIIWAGYQLSEKSLIKGGITFSDYKYEIPRDQLPGVTQDKNAYERIFTTFTIGYNYRF